MNRFIHSYLRTSELILNYYTGQEPFSDFIKRYFKLQPKFGSRDRKTITELCFCYMRMGKSLESAIISDQILTGYFLTHEKDNGIIAEFKSDWLDFLSKPLSEKFDLVQAAFPFFNHEQIFPFQSTLSNGLSLTELKNGCFNRSNVFLRVRPGREDIVKKAISDSKLPTQMVSERCYSFPSGTKVEQFIKINKDAVIQDISSQQTSKFLPLLIISHPSIWDACAASGGKSIMLKDHYGKLTLYVSDLRDSILQQLKVRFDEAGVKADKSFRVDLTEKVHPTISKTFPKEGFDLILADVPCSGSGTWARNPEWIRVFDEKELTRYQDRQILIVKNSIPFVKRGGYFLYITCSVFRKENEDVVAYIQSSSGLKLVQSGTISNFNEGGDCLFAALFTLEA